MKDRYTHWDNVKSIPHSFLFGKVPCSEGKTIVHYAHIFTMHELDLLSQTQFAELSKQVQEVVKKFSPNEQYTRELLIFGLRLLLFIGGFLLFSTPILLVKIFALITISYAYFGIGLTGTHETAHRSFVRSPKLNIVLSYIFSDFWASQSNLWWYKRHVQVHHAYTNMPEHDPQIFYYRWINRFVFFFVVPYLMIFWLIAHSIKFLWGRPKELSLYLVSMIAGFIFQTWLFTLVTPTLFWAVICMIAMRIMFAPIFVHLAIFNHAGLFEPESKPPWLPHQTKATRNLKRNWFIDGLGGNGFVACHIEHHLFPTFSNHMLAQIHPVVQTYLAQHGYEYREDGYLTCLGICLRKYKELFTTTVDGII